MCSDLEKFHTYLYGRHVIIQKDHKPLQMIQQKTIHAAPPHLQCMLLHMQKYDYTIHYNPGKEMVLAKHLCCFPFCRESLPIPIHQNIQNVQLSTSELDAIQGAIKYNQVYSTVYCLTLREWPDHLKQVPRITQHFWGAQDELSLEASILLKGSQICIPSELLNCTLAEPHGAHQGIEKMQAQAREAVYWPGIYASITDYACTGTPYAQDLSSSSANASPRHLLWSVA